MSKVIDFAAFENKVPAKLTEKIKRDVKYIEEETPFGNIKNFHVYENEYFVKIGFSTGVYLKVYEYFKIGDSFSEIELTSVNYHFIKELFEGGGK